MTKFFDNRKQIHKDVGRRYRECQKGHWIATNSPDGDMPFGFIAVDEIQCSKLLKLYHTYEFSDRFQVITENSCYGGLDNYVKTGDFKRQRRQEKLC